MTKIYINGEIADIKDTRISMRLKSPVFYKQTHFSYNFSIPATRKNKKILGYPDYVGNYTVNKIYDCHIECKGFHITGEVVIRDIKRKTIELFFKQDHINAVDGLKKTRLNDVNYSETFNNFVSAYKGDPTTHNFCCATLRVSNDDNLSYWKEYVVNEGIKPEKYSKISEIFLNYYVSPNGDIEEQIFHGMFSAEDYYSGTPQEENEDPNDRDYIYHLYSLPMGFWYLQFVIRKILEDYNIGTNIFETDPMLHDLILLTFHEGQEYNDITSTISFKKNLPGYTIYDFISKLETYFQARFIFNFNTMSLDIVSFQSIIDSSDVEKWSYPYRYSQKGVVEEKNYTYEFDEKKSIYFDSYTTGENNRDNVMLPLTTYLSNEQSEEDHTKKVHFTQYTTFSDRRWYRIFKFPVFDKTIYKPYEDSNIPLKVDEQPPMFLAYKNTLTDDQILIEGDGTSAQQPQDKYVVTNHETYYHAHWRKESTHGSYDGYSLDIQEEGNYEDVYSRFHSKVQFWQNNLRRDVKLEMDIPAYKLTNFDFRKKRQIDGNNYLLKQINLEITDKDIKVSSVDAVTVP
jgi:hypothetical protein